MKTTFRLLAISAASTIVMLGGPALGHEAWLLTPDEIVALSREPVPALFTSRWIMLGAAIIAAVALVGAIRGDRRLAVREQRLFAPVVPLATRIGPLLVRVGLTIMLGLGATGGLPRSGTGMWTQPVLFVPDMQLSLVQGWDWLIPAQIALAGLLAAGIVTRGAALGVIALAFTGLLAFGAAFLPYAAHFIAPALMLIVVGPGVLAVDNHLQVGPAFPIPQRLRRWMWAAILAMIGGTFAYLSVTVKLTQPTLLIAILKHGEVPLMGLPLEWAALIMAGVELVAGVLLAIGRCVRPVALFLICAFTFFAVTIGETPLFHSNLYGAAALLLLSGARLPRQRSAMPVGAPAIA